MTRALLRYDVAGHRISQRVALDEVVLPGLHIEAMGSGVWCVTAKGVTLYVGPRHVTVVEVEPGEHAGCSDARCRCGCPACVKHRRRLERVASEGAPTAERLQREMRERGLR